MGVGYTTFGLTELKLWLKKMLYLTLGPLNFESTTIDYVTIVLMVQIQRFSDFLKA